MLCHENRQNLYELKFLFQVAFEFSIVENSANTVIISITNLKKRSLLYFLGHTEITFYAFQEVDDHFKRCEITI